MERVGDRRREMDMDGDEREKNGKNIEEAGRRCEGGASYTHALTSTVRLQGLRDWMRSKGSRRGM